MWIVYDPLLQVFIDVQKDYDSLDRGRCIEIIRGYGMGTNLQRLIQRYWDRQKVVPKASKFYESPFSMGRGVTQGEPVYP